LAHHPNILGIKDSSGDVERVGKIVETTRGIRKGSATVTTVFAAVTGRMQAASSSAAQGEPANFVAAGQLGSGATALAAVLPPPPLQTRTKEIGFQVLVGSAQTFLRSLEVGASGGVVAMADFVPQAFHEIYTAWRDKDMVLAAEKQHRLVHAGDEICARMGIPGIKYAMDFNGYFGGSARLPLLPLTADERRTVEELLIDFRN
jgi:dihydrodipicolinate synthase/N-acetylneuraminate lyase